MTLVGLATRNALARRTRFLLTILGVAVTVATLGFLRTVIDAYYAGVDSAARERLVVRNAASLAVRLPIAYREKIAAVDGVTAVSPADWFGGIYIDEKNYFPQIAVDPEPFFTLFPEYLLSDEERQAWKADRAGAIVGEKLARRYGWQVGQVITLKGTLFPGEWPLTIRGIYKPRDPSTIATNLFLQWAYVDARSPPTQQGEALAYYVAVKDPAASAQVAGAIDERFRGGAAETLSESERSFQLGFISMAGAVLDVLHAVSASMLVILLLVLGNAIASSVRERTGELAVMKALGFRGRHLAWLIALESLWSGLAGGLIGVGLCVLLVRSFASFMDQNLGAFFPIFVLRTSTVVFLLVASVALGMAAAVVPLWKALRLPVAHALRRVD